MPQRVEALDPHRVVSSVSRSVLRGCFETLVDRERGFAPGLAERWESLPNGSGWRFHLRRDVRFHDDSPLDAAAVVRAIERFHDPRVGNILGGALGDVTEIAPAGEYSLDFRTAAASSLVPRALGRVPIALSPDGDIDATPVGTGPFRPTGLAADGSATLERFDGYWGEAATCERVVWTPVGEAAERIRAVADGRADLATAIEPAALSQTHPGVELVRRPNMLSTSIMLNLRHDALASREVRRAINLAVDVDGLIRDVLHGAGRPLPGPASADMLGADPGVSPYPHDPARARELIAAAGAVGSPLTIAYPGDRYATAAATCERVAAALSDAGLAATAVPLPWGPFVDGIKAKTHDAFYLQISTMAPERLLLNEFSSRVRGVGWQNYVNEEVNEVLTQVVATLDDGARVGLLAQAAQLLREDAPWLFLFNEDDVYAQAPAAAGWEARPNGFVDVTAARGAGR